MGKVYSNIVDKLPPIDASSFNAFTIYAQGDNSYGTITNAVKQLTVVRLWTGNFQTFALDKDGHFYAWGINDFFQLGNSKSVSYAFAKEEDKNAYHFIDTFSLLSSEPGYTSSLWFPPLFPFTGRRVKTIGCGDGFTVFLLKEGMVYSVGRDDKGQLGVDLLFSEAKVVSGKKCSNTLREVDFFSKRKINVVNVSCGSDFVFAQDDFNQYYSWGNNDHSQLCRETVNYHAFTPEKVDSISKLDNKVNALKCGWMHGCLLSEKGELIIWGNPYYDYNSSFHDITNPTKVQLPSDKVIDFSSGFHHICVIVFESDRYELYSFGANDFGQLGYETNEEYITIPSRVTFPEEGQIADVVCGAFHTICKLNNNVIYGFGQNDNKQVGDYTAEFITWPAVYNWKINEGLFLHRILCGNGYTMVLKRKTEGDIEDQMTKESYVKVQPNLE